MKDDPIVIPIACRLFFATPKLKSLLVGPRKRGAPWDWLFERIVPGDIGGSEAIGVRESENDGRC